LITQLVYTSRPRFDLADPAGKLALGQILASARRNNRSFGVTGFLLVGTDWFAQILEGKGNDVTTIFKRILGDDRHEHVRLLDTRLSRTRLFGDWDMGVTSRPLQSYQLAGMDEMVKAIDLTMADGTNTQLNADRMITLAHSMATIEACTPNP
jgi:Sensors of blue-light using FAD